MFIWNKLKSIQYHKYTLPNWFTYAIFILFYLIFYFLYIPISDKFLLFSIDAVFWVYLFVIIVLTIYYNDFYIFILLFFVYYTYFSRLFL
jgi:hypothetical protein